MDNSSIQLLYFGHVVQVPYTVRLPFVALIEMIHLFKDAMVSITGNMSDLLHYSSWHYNSSCPWCRCRESTPQLLS